MVDAAQSAGHVSLDVKKMNCDFLAFSAHKMFGPSGVGVLYGKKELLRTLRPFLFGGGMIRDVRRDGFELAESPVRFEAGTPNIEGVIGFGQAVDFVQHIGVDKIGSWNAMLYDYCLERMKKMKDIQLYAGVGENIGIISFNVDGAHPHDVASLLDDYGICVRAGNHCCIPLMKQLHLDGTVRISFHIYNTLKEINIFLRALEDTAKVLHE